eukprot:279757-Amphidinium_carterae.2
MIAFNKWVAKKGKYNNWSNGWTKGKDEGKGKDKGAGKKGDYNHKWTGKTKAKKTQSLVTLVERRATTHHNAGTIRMDPKDRHINSTAMDNSHRTINNNTTVEKEKAHANLGTKDGSIITTKELARQVSHNHKFSTLQTTLNTGIINQITYNSKFAVQRNSHLEHHHNHYNHRWGHSTMKHSTPLVINVNEKTPTTYKKNWAIIYKNSCLSLSNHIL